jgi:hypothetical protein
MPTAEALKFSSLVVGLGAQAYDLRAQLAHQPLPCLNGLRQLLMLAPHNGHLRRLRRRRLLLRACTLSHCARQSGTRLAPGACRLWYRSLGRHHHDMVVADGVEG